MATGFSVVDALNKNSKAGIDESPRARFRTKDISIFKMYRNELNFYSIEAIEELAGDILAFGLKQNIELVYDPCEKGEYRIVAGERRWIALKLLVSRGYKEFEIATSKLTTPQDADEEQVEIIIANAYRNKSVVDMIEEEKRLKESLEKMKADGKQIKGYDLTSGRLRDVIASMLHMSKTKVAQIESINNNLIPEFEEELKSERLTFSAAYELSGMSKQEQQEALDKYKESGELAHKDIKAMKDEMAAGQQGSESDTELKGESISEENEVVGDDYQTPHPQGIISICYSCMEYETCDVKSGTCTSCDQYKDRIKKNKTDEQRYSEEQDTIDRETHRKIRTQAEQEKMGNLPSDIEQKKKDVRISQSMYERINTGIQSYMILKNEGYKERDIIILIELSDGHTTGRTLESVITCIDDDTTSNALEEGYCVINLQTQNIISLLEKAAEEIENFYEQETELTGKIRELINLWQEV